MKKAVLATNSISHLLVDAACASALFSCGGDLMILALVYNTLAFSTQCLVGLFTDRLFSTARLTLIASLAVALGCDLPLPDLLSVIIVGLGNSLFHVAAGTTTLKMSEGRAAPLGIFVAPGAIGLALGTLFPWLGMLYSALLVVFAALSLRFHSRVPAFLNLPPPQKPAKTWVIAVLIAAVAVRAIGGSAVSFPWKNGAGLTLLTVLFVYMGKTLGGFACDKLSARKTAVVSIPIAALCIAFLSAYIAPSLIGQLLLNLTMPITLWLLYKAMPDSPGTSFGLAASALWPGTLLGGLISLTGSLLWLLVLICFALALIAILLSYKELNHEEIS